MHKKIFIYVCFLLLAIIISMVRFSNDWRRFIGLDTGFVQACESLNGKELTYSNIKSLNGKCYLKCDKDAMCVTIGKCEEKHIQQLQEFKNKCGDPEIDKIDIGMEDIIYNSNNNYEPADPYYKCVDNYMKGEQSSNLHINSVGGFSVTQSSLDGAWVCRISTINSKIRAVSGFLDD